MVLPGFQRRFEWDYQRQHALIRTILNGYPAGSLLLLQYPRGENLGKRLIDGVDSSCESVHPERVILDGQQRLTTLYKALFWRFGFYSLRAFVSIDDVSKFFDGTGKLPDSNKKEGIDLVKKSIHFMDPSMAKMVYGDLTKQFDEGMIPLTCVFGKEQVTYEGVEKEIGFDEWRATYAEYHEPDDKNKRLALNKKLEEIKRRLISPIADYRFPVVVLQEKTEPQAVCQVFVDLNIQQKPLSPFEVAAAKVWPFGIDLYKEWDEAKKIPTLDEFSLDPVLPLKAIALLQTNQDPDLRVSCSKKTLYELKPNNFIEEWKRVVDALDWLLRLLKAECGVLDRKWLPYSALLASMSATLIYAEENGLQREQLDVKRKLLCWYWCSILTEMYAGGTDSHNARDFEEMRVWINGGDYPGTVKYFSSMFNSDILRNTTSGGRYKSVICLLLKNHAKDFRTAQAISTSLILDENIEDHHIFPDNYLEPNVQDWTKRNCVLNRALVDELTNKTIGNKAPSIYLKEIESNIGLGSLQEVLRSQFLPDESDSSLFLDDYDGFLDKRLESVAKEIAKVTAPP
jgi:hypothetical protein